MTQPLRLLMVGHSYVVALNRRLPHEMARVGNGRWEVTVAALSFVHGDLRPIPVEHFPDEAFRLVSVPAYLTRRPHVMLYGRSLPKLLRERWDLIHCWEEPYILSGGQVAWWAGSSPLAYYSFQNIPKRYPPPFNRIERFTIRRAAGWIAAGQMVDQALRSREGYGKKPHITIPLGVDTGVFQPDPAARQQIWQRLGWSRHGPPVVGYLGRFVPEKGLSLLTGVLDALQSPWRALFVGGGAMEGELRAWAEKHGGERVRIITGVPHDVVPPYLNAMDLLVAPSQTMRHWREQLGRMLIEGMACGVPVVGSDSGEIPFVIGDAGVVLPEADHTAWTKVVTQLLESPERRAELGARGRARAEALFAWPVIARQHLDFVDQLLHTLSALRCRT